MLLQLPTFNAVLNPCAVDQATAFAAHPAGHFCGQCQRVVQDFSQSADPVADLAAARAASPDGRVCGRFGAAQVQRPKLTHRLRWFVVALVLVVAQGLSAREALAQVRRGIDYTQEIAKPRSERLAAARHDSAALNEQNPQPFLGVVIEQMPTFRGGGNSEVVKYIQQQVVWPRQDGKIIQAQGRVFASFTVDASGRVRRPKIVKGLQPLFDAEVLRVLQIMPNFKPGRQNGKPVAVDMVVPITFKLK